jgi:hypothetical protein
MIPDAIRRKRTRPKCGTGTPEASSFPVQRHQEQLSWPGVLDSPGMYSGETPKRFSKHMRQLRDSIVQWSVYKRSLLINTELNVFV